MKDYTKDKFAANPYYDPGEISSIRLVAPKFGIITVKRGDTISIKVTDSLAIKKQQYVKYHKDGDTYEFAYVVKDKTLDYLDIIFDQRRVMRFKVKMSR